MFKMKGYYIIGTLNNGNELEVHATIVEEDETVAVNKFLWKMKELWKCSAEIVSATLVPIYW